MNLTTLSQLVVTTLEENKATDVRVLDVSKLTNMTDQLIVCSAISKRHIDALKNKVIVAVKAQDKPPLSSNGDSDSGWVLIDLQDIIVHIMLPEARELYTLEKLWSMTELTRNNQA
jgi:ribosome-associated protein